MYTRCTVQAGEAGEAGLHVSAVCSRMNYISQRRTLISPSAAAA